jgi:hypothetical protein
VLAIETTENLAFLPAVVFPSVVIPRTSPARYPVPEVLTVAATATPLEMVISAV